MDVKTIWENVYVEPLFLLNTSIFTFYDKFERLLSSQVGQFLLSNIKKMIVFSTVSE